MESSLTERRGLKPAVNAPISASLRSRLSQRDVD